MVKKKILVVAPSSYPINGPEAMVNAKHILLLCKMGYSVDLVCRGIRKQNNIYPTKENMPYFYENVHSIVTIVVNTNWNFKTLLRHTLNVDMFIKLQIGVWMLLFIVRRI